MTQTIQPRQGVVRPWPTWQLGLLVVAPAVALVARLLNTPWYQDDSDRPDNARFLTEVASSTVANDIGAVLTLASGLLYAAVAVAVGQSLRARMPRVGTTGMLLAVVGGFGLVAFADQLLVAGQAARLEEHRPAMVALLDAMYDSPSAGLSYLLLILGALGWVLLATALYRTRLVARGAAVVAGIGGAGVMLTAPGPAVAFIAGAAVISLVGLTWMAVSLRGASGA